MLALRDATELGLFARFERAHCALLHRFFGIFRPIFSLLCLRDRTLHLGSRRRWFLGGRLVGGLLVAGLLGRSFVVLAACRCSERVALVSAIFRVLHGASIRVAIAHEVLCLLVRARHAAVLFSESQHLVPWKESLSLLVSGLLDHLRRTWIVDTLSIVLVDDEYFAIPLWERLVTFVLTGFL